MLASMRASSYVPRQRRLKLCKSVLSHSVLELAVKAFGDLQTPARSSDVLLNCLQHEDSLKSFRFDFLSCWEVLYYLILFLKISIA